MKKLLLFFFFLSSCGYPDIDSVPNFKELDLTVEEIIDLCQLSSNDKSEIEICIEEKQKNNEKN
tara:strand:+ start:143 stop:334 length:192 start_codon:yes stop_codon:yes gene_type:complete